MAVASARGAIAMTVPAASAAELDISKPGVPPKRRRARAACAGEAMYRMPAAPTLETAAASEPRSADIASLGGVVVDAANGVTPASSPAGRVDDAAVEVNIARSNASPAASIITERRTCSI